MKLNISIMAKMFLLMAIMGGNIFYLNNVLAQSNPLTSTNANSGASSGNSNGDSGIGGEHSGNSDGDSGNNQGDSGE